MSPLPSNGPKSVKRRAECRSAARSLVFGMALVAGCSDGDRQNERSAGDILKAAEAWRSEHDRGCPTVMVLKSSGALDKEAPADDSWGEHFRVTCTSSSVSVRSAAADGKLNTDDDMSVSSSVRR